MAIRVRHDKGYSALAGQAAFMAGAQRAQREQQQRQQEMASRAAAQQQANQVDLIRAQMGNAKDVYLANRRMGQDQQQFEAGLADKQAQRDFQAQNYEDLREHQIDQIHERREADKQFEIFKEAAPDRARELELQRLDQAEMELETSDIYEEDQKLEARNRIQERRKQLDTSRPPPTPEEQKAQLARDWDTSTYRDEETGQRWIKSKDGEWKAINPPKQDDPDLELAKERQKSRIETEKAAQARLDKIRDKKIDFFMKNREYEGPVDPKTGIAPVKQRDAGELKKLWDEVAGFLGEDQEEQQQGQGQQQAAPGQAPPQQQAVPPQVAGQPSQPQQQAMQQFADAGVAPIAMMPPQIQQQMAQMGQLEPEVIIDQQQYQQLPPGYVYLAQDGQVRVKQGGNPQVAQR
jgi:hypothetical protein